MSNRGEVNKKGNENKGRKVGGKERNSVEGEEYSLKRKKRKEKRGKKRGKKRGDQMRQSVCI